MYKCVVLMFLQGTEETAEESSLRILKRKNDRHQGTAHFVELRDSKGVR